MFVMVFKVLLDTLILLNVLFELDSWCIKMYVNNKCIV